MNRFDLRRCLSIGLGAAMLALMLDTLSLEALLAKASRAVWVMSGPLDPTGGEAAPPA